MKFLPLTITVVSAGFLFYSGTSYAGCSESQAVKIVKDKYYDNIFDRVSCTANVGQDYIGVKCKVTGDKNTYEYTLKNLSGSGECFVVFDEQ